MGKWKLVLIFFPRHIVTRSCYVMFLSELCVGRENLFSCLHAFNLIDLTDIKNWNCGEVEVTLSMIENFCARVRMRWVNYTKKNESLKVKMLKERNEFLTFSRVTLWLPKRYFFFVLGAGICQRREQKGWKTSANFFFPFHWLSFASSDPSTFFSAPLTHIKERRKISSNFSQFAICSGCCFTSLSGE